MAIQTLSPFLKIINFNCILEYIINCETQRLAWHFQYGRFQTKKYALETLRLAFTKYKWKCLCAEAPEKKPQAKELEEWPVLIDNQGMMDSNHTDTTIYSMTLRGVL